MGYGTPMMSPKKPRRRCLFFTAKRTLRAKRRVFRTRTFRHTEDFFHTTVPYFFDYYGDLNPNVGLAQCPKYFPHVQDRDRTRPSTGAGEVAKQTSDARYRTLWT